MSKEKLRAACVKIVAVNGCPISLIEDEGFQMLIDPIIKALEPNSAINCRNVRLGIPINLTVNALAVGYAAKAIETMSQIYFNFMRRKLIARSGLGKPLCFSSICLLKTFLHVLWFGLIKRMLTKCGS
jgi:hypothetical protein